MRIIVLNCIRTIVFSIKRRHKKMWRADAFSDELKLNLKTFLLPEELANRCLIKNYTFDIASCYLKYRAIPRECFLFSLRTVKSDMRKLILTNMHKNKYLLVEQLHKLLHNHTYIGWDFSLTSTSRVLIEGNLEQFLSECADNDSIKDEFENLLA